MSECNYSGCGHEGKIDGLCAKHHGLREKALGRTAQTDEESCSKREKKAADKKEKKQLAAIKRPTVATVDVINHPAHYTKGKIEVIDFITDQEMGYLDGNIIKYVARYPYKGTPIEDLKKARWYLNRLIEQAEG